MYCANCENFCKNIVLCGQCLCLGIFFWNLAILFSNSSQGSEKQKQNRHSLIKLRLTNLNNFIRKRVTAKSNDFTSLLFNGQHSKPYNKIGKHLHLTNSRTTSYYYYLHEIFGARGFRSAAPAIWNSLPSNVRSYYTITTFRRHLKSHLFHSAFATA